MTVDIEKMKALALAATPSPWQWWTSNSTLRLTAFGGRDGGVLSAYSSLGHADIACSVTDQAFIAACRTAVPELIAEVERLRAELAAGAARQGGGTSPDVSVINYGNPVDNFSGGAAGTEKDAERYRWLRAQHWNESNMAVVRYPKTSVKLGFDCPSGERLDEAIDAAIGAHTKAGKAPA
jgi:hypothetical protein